MKVKLSKLMVKNPIAAYEDYAQVRLSRDSFLVAIACAISAAGFVHGFIIAQSQLLLTNEHFLNLMNTSYAEFSQKFISMFYAGEILGALCVFPFMDGLGRRKALGGACVLCISSLVCCAVTTSASSLLWSRFLVGVALGALINTSAIYLSEVSPSSRRGRSIAFLSINTLLGSLLGTTLYYLSTSRAWAWRVALLLPVAPLLLQGIILFYLPESPRWLLAKKTPTDCSVALGYFRRAADTSREFSDIYRALSSDARLSDTIWDLLAMPSIRLRLLVTCVLSIMQQFVGVQVISLFGFHILQQMRVPAAGGGGGDGSLDGVYGGGGRNHDAYAHTLLLLLPIALSGLAGSALAYRYIDRHGRRWLLLVGSAAMALCWLLARMCVFHELHATVGLTRGGADVLHNITASSNAAATPAPGPFDGWPHAPAHRTLLGLAALHVPAPGAVNHVLFVLLICGLSLAYSLSWGTVGWVYPAEIFPYRARGKLNAIMTSVHYLAAVLSSSTISALLGPGLGDDPDDAARRHGLEQMERCFLYLALVCLAMVAFVFVSVPETQGLMLEEMEELFKVEPPTPPTLAANGTTPSLISVAPSLHCCFCLPTGPLLGFRQLPRFRSIAVHGVGMGGSLGGHLGAGAGAWPASHSDSGCATPRGAAATGLSSSSASLYGSLWQYYQYYSQGVQASPHGSLVFSGLEGGDQVLGPAFEAEALLPGPIYEPTQLHKYSNEMRENKFAYFHAAPQTYGTMGGGDSDCPPFGASEDDEEKMFSVGDFADLTGYGALDVSSAEVSMLSAGNPLGEADEADGETLPVNFLDRDRNFLDSLLGPQKGRRRG